MRSVEPAFVGHSRLLLVDGLVDLYEKTVDSGQSLWVSLEAPSGWGKTRVVHELYKQLAASQPDPKYWPSTIVNPEDLALEGTGGVAYRRKRVYPHGQVRQADSVPDFMWWGIACSNRNEVASNALAEDLSQLDDHALFLEAQWRALATFKDRNTAAYREWRQAVIDEGVVAAVGKLLEAAGTEIPGLGLVLKGVRWVKQRSDQARVTHEAIGKPSIIGGTDSSDIVDDIVDDLQRISIHIPILVFVEDFHLADRLLIELVERLVTSTAKIMIVTSCWPGRLEETVPELLAQTVSGRIVRVEHDQPTDVRLPVGAGLGELPPAAGAELVRFFFPNATNRTIEGLVSHYPNPLGIELACIGEGGPSDNALDLTPDEISVLPTEVKDQYLKVWRLLPQHVQQALALAAWGIPTEINPATGDARWDNPFVVEAVTTMISQRAAEITAALTTTVDAYAWARIADEAGILRLFHEPVMRRIAADNPPSEFHRKRIQWQKTLANLLTGSTVVLTLHRANLVAALHAEGFIPTSTLVLDAYLTRVDDLADKPREYEELLRLGKRAIELADNADPSQQRVAISIRAYTAQAHHEHGNVAEATAEYAVVLTDCRRVLGDDHPDTLTSRNNLAYAYHSAGRLDEATAQYEAVLSDRRRVLGDDHPSTLTSRNNLADAYQSLGKLEEAIAQFEAVLSDRRRVLGDDHPSTLTSRNNLATAYQSAGRLDEATAQYEAAWEVAHRILSPRHAVYKAIRNYLDDLQAPRRMQTGAKRPKRPKRR